MKTLLPYFVLISSILDGLFLGYVLLNLPPLTVMPIWYGSGLMICIIFYLVNRHKVPTFYGFREHWGKIIGLYFFSVLAGVCWMLAVYHLGVGLSTVLDQVQFLLLILWGVFMLKEPFSKYSLLSTILMLVGVSAITQGAHQEQDWVGFIYTALMVFGFASTTIIRKSLAGKVNHNTLVAIRAGLLLSGACCASLYWYDAPLSNYTFDYYLWFVLIIGGMIGVGLNHHITLAALKHTTLSHYILVQMLEPMLMLLAGVLLYQDIITPLQFEGIALVLIGKAVLVGSKWKKKN